MAKARRIGVKLVAGCLVGLSGVSAVNAAPTVAQMLTYRPRQDKIVYSTPSAPEQEACKVEPAKGTNNNGWILRDARGQMLRRYVDLNADGKVDLWSYYHEGAEVYRELDANANGKVDQYRWFNTAGTRWGIDVNEDGKIDGYKMISAEEVSQEALQALVTRDFARLQSLMLSEAEIKTLELSNGEAGRVRQQLAKAQAKFQATTSKLALGEKTEWVRLDVAMPQCLPADQTGNARDVVHYGRGTVLFENNGKHEFLNLGEIVQVGLAWRLTDAPGDDDAASPTTDPAVQKIVEELKELDKNPPQSGAEIVQYNLKRADVLTRILAVEKSEQRDQWTQQVAECLSAAAQSGADTDKAAYNRLAQLATQVAKDKPGSNLAAYVAFREMQADYSSKLKGITKNEEYPALQAKWVERLSQYVQAYPKADDAPEALIQLGTVSEFVNKEVEAKNWYARLVKDFPSHASAAKAAGAVRRLDSEGKPFELTANTPNGPFEIAKMSGKVVIVYYWASWNQQCVGDFARLKVLLGSYAAKGVELVCVNLDNEPTNPEITKGLPPCVQIAQPGGLDSPLATHYGIHSLPHMFLVGKDGNVLSRTVQVGNLEEELKKQIK